MKSLEISGKTVEDAIHKGLEKLGIDRENAEVEIVSEASAGLFGIIGSKQALVRITQKAAPDLYLTEFLDKVLSSMGLRGEFDVSEEEEALKINITGSRMGMLIGKRGQTLNALQYLLNVIYHKRFPGQGRRVVLDVEDYREKREQTLRALADKIARKVALYRKEVVLEPMNPQERRIIHTALQDNPSVDTYSQGEEPYRKVIIAPK